MPVRTGQTAAGTVTVRWDRDVRGSDSRHVMRAHAADVTVLLTGPADAAGRLTCPLTGLPFAPADGEVDRTRGEAGGYAPGTVALVSARGNAARGVLQSAGRDVAGAARYAADVAAAAARCTLPTVAAARATVGAWARDDAAADLLTGPYGRG